jgi:hypothetical protein
VRAPRKAPLIGDRVLELLSGDHISSGDLILDVDIGFRIIAKPP